MSTAAAEVRFPTIHELAEMLGNYAMRNEGDRELAIRCLAKEAGAFAKLVRSLSQGELPEEAQIQIRNMRLVEIADARAHLDREMQALDSEEKALAKQARSK